MGRFFYDENSPQVTFEAKPYSRKSQRLSSDSDYKNNLPFGPDQLNSPPRAKFTDRS